MFVVGSGGNASNSSIGTRYPILYWSSIPMPVPLSWCVIVSTYIFIFYLQVIAIAIATRADGRTMAVDRKVVVHVSDGSVNKNLLKLPATIRFEYVDDMSLDFCTIYWFYTLYTCGHILTVEWIIQTCNSYMDSLIPTCVEVADFASVITLINDDHLHAIDVISPLKQAWPRIGYHHNCAGTCQSALRCVL